VEKGRNGLACMGSGVCRAGGIGVSYLYPEYGAFAVHLLVVFVGLCAGLLHAAIVILWRVEVKPTIGATK
jgi:hypothetical protein